jgi:hypothetical protein
MSRGVGSAARSAFLGSCSMFQGMLFIAFMAPARGWKLICTTFLKMLTITSPGSGWGDLP